MEEHLVFVCAKEGVQVVCGCGSVIFNIRRLTSIAHLVHNFCLTLISLPFSFPFFRSTRISWVKLFFPVHESVEIGAEVRLEAVLHALLEEQLEEFASLARVFAGYDVTVSQSLHLPDTNVAKVSNRRRHNHQGAPIRRPFLSDINRQVLCIVDCRRAESESVEVAYKADRGYPGRDDQIGGGTQEEL